MAGTLTKDLQAPTKNRISQSNCCEVQIILFHLCTHCDAVKIILIKRNTPTGKGLSIIGSSSKPSKFPLLLHTGFATSHKYLHVAQTCMLRNSKLWHMPQVLPCCATANFDTRHKNCHVVQRLFSNTCPSDSRVPSCCARAIMLRYGWSQIPAGQLQTVETAGLKYLQVNFRRLV